MSGRRRCDEILLAVGELLAPFAEPNCTTRVSNQSNSDPDESARARGVPIVSPSSPASCGAHDARSAMAFARRPGG